MTAAKVCAWDFGRLPTGWVCCWHAWNEPRTPSVVFQPSPRDSNYFGRAPRRWKTPGYLQRSLRDSLVFPIFRS